MAQDRSYLKNEWIDNKIAASFLTLSTLTRSTSESEIYSYENNSIITLKSKANLGDALSWQEVSHKIPNYTFPIKTLVVNKRFCIGYVTDEIDGLNGYECIDKINNLEVRKSIANNLVNMYTEIKYKNVAYTNWCLENIMITFSREIKLINPQFFIDIQQYPKLKSEFIDYNFCVLIFSILYGLDFTIVNSEEIPDLQIPEIIKEILSKKKNEKITIEEIRKIIRLTQKEFVYQSQIQKLIRKFPIPKEFSNN